VSGWYGAGDAACPVSAGRTVAVGVDGAEDGLEAVLAEPGAHGGAGEEELRERDEPVVVEVKRRKLLRGEEGASEWVRLDRRIGAHAPEQGGGTFCRLLVSPTHDSTCTNASAAS
jgi:hypothetical protein